MKNVFDKVYCILNLDADVIMIAVGTPERSDGSANLDYIKQVSKQISETITKDTLVVGEVFNSVGKLEIDNVTVKKADMLDETSPIGLPFADIIISNPPYIKTDELKDLQEEVQFEPAIALDGGEDGLVFYRALKNNWFPFLNRDGLMILECGENQSKDILEIFLTSAKGARIIEDGQGIERIIVLKK